MRPVLWRHWLTGAALFGLSVLVTVTPTTAILASSFADPRAVELPQAEAGDEDFGVQLAWEPIDTAPEAVVEPEAHADEEPESTHRSAAPTRGDPVASAPIATRTARAIDRETLPRSPSTATKAKAKGAKCLDPDPRIQDLGEGRYEVERSLAESYADLDRLRTLGFVVQHTDASGRPDGYRIGGIRCGNALHQSGLRRGDVIRSVNGRPTRTALQIMTAWLGERDAAVLKLEILREGKRQTLVYRLT